MSNNPPALNTDRELWREVEDDYYAPSIHVTVRGGIGINVGGRVIVKPLRDWHALASADRSPEGEDPAEGLHAEHESAVTAKPADAQPLSGDS